jgi:hypothetical protein
VGLAELHSLATGRSTPGVAGACVLFALESNKVVTTSSKNKLKVMKAIGAELSCSVDTIRDRAKELRQLMLTLIRSFPHGATAQEKTLLRFLNLTMPSLRSLLSSSSAKPAQTTDDVFGKKTMALAASAAVKNADDSVRVSIACPSRPLEPEAPIVKVEGQEFAFSSLPSLT